MKKFLARIVVKRLLFNTQHFRNREIVLVVIVRSLFQLSLVDSKKIVWEAFEKYHMEVKN